MVRNAVHTSMLSRHGQLTKSWPSPPSAFSRRFICELEVSTSWRNWPCHSKYRMIAAADAITAATQQTAAPRLDLNARPCNGATNQRRVTSIKDAPPMFCLDIAANVSATPDSAAPTTPRRVDGFDAE